MPVLGSLFHVTLTPLFGGVGGLTYPFGQCGARVPFSDPAQSIDVFEESHGLWRYPARKG